MGGPTLAEVKRDGSVQLPAAAAPGVRHLQELRGPLPCCLHGRQRRGDAWQGHLVRAEGRGRRWRKEEVRHRERRVTRGRLSCVQGMMAKVLRFCSSEAREIVRACQPWRLRLCHKVPFEDAPERATFVSEGFKNRSKRRK